MKLSKILMSSALLLSGLFASAQQQEAKTEYVFNPHWYFQLQGGVQETLGETCFGKLLSPNAQIGLGYNFNPYVGLRLAVNGWQSKGAFEYNNDRNVYKWNYVAPALDLTVDLTNVFGGFNPKRVVAVGVFAGVGANIAFKNDEAADVKAKLNAANVDALRLYWDGTKTRFLTQFGANLDFKVSSRVSLGIELQANFVPDSYNSKKAGNSDWYFNGLVGIKVALGKTHSTKVIPAVVPTTVYKRDTIYVDRIVEKPVEKIVEKIVEARKQALRRDVFFTLAKTLISKTEMLKVDDIANFMKENPNTKVTVTGYADKGTGTKEINLRLSKQRAEAVAKALYEKGISSDRVKVLSMDADMEQPYIDPIQNRVAICIAE